MSQAMREGIRRYYRRSVSMETKNEGFCAKFAAFCEMFDCAFDRLLEACFNRSADFVARCAPAKGGVLQASGRMVL